MKYATKRWLMFTFMFLLSLSPALNGTAETVNSVHEALFWGEAAETGASGSSVSYPVLMAEENPEALTLAAEINETIQETALIPEYLQLLSMIQEGSTGLFMDYRMSCPYTWKNETEDDYSCSPYVSILLSAKGRMLTGRPSQIYYPITLDLKTGESIAFEDLFIDPEGAKAFMESCLEEEVEPTLSTYLENNQLFPIPYDRFFLDGYGNLILYYENSQLSFLSGNSGAVAFRYSELWNWLDTSPDGIPMSVLSNPDEYASQPAVIAEQMDQVCLGSHPLYGFGMEGELGMAVNALTALYPQAADSEYYPCGACFEAEAPTLRGTLVLTDEEETIVTGLLSHRVDFFGIMTGKTTLAEAEALMDQEPLARLPFDETTAEKYRVCPGTAVFYSLNGDRFVLYADESGIVQYIELSLQTES